MRFFLTTVLSILFLSTCGRYPVKNHIKVGTISGPESILVYTAAAPALKEHGLEIEVVEFSSYDEPNAALARGEIDANIYQHKPFLKEEMEEKHYDFAVVGKTFIYPMAIYSRQIHSLKQLYEGAKIAVPLDLTNQLRALMLCEKAGLITLVKNPNLHQGLKKWIASNPHRYQFIPIPANELPSALDNYTLAVINANYAYYIDLLPKRDGLFVEDDLSPYANLIVTTKAKAKDPVMQELVSAMHSDAVVEQADKLFQGQALKAWD